MRNTPCFAINSTFYSHLDHCKKITNQKIVTYVLIDWKIIRCLKMIIEYYVTYRYLARTWIYFLFYLYFVARVNLYKESYILKRVEQLYTKVYAFREMHCP